MKWNIHRETKTCSEWHESEIGRVEHRGASGWEAWVYIANSPRKDAIQHKVGEGYRSASSARSAVMRQYRKYKPYPGNPYVVYNPYEPY